MPSVSTAYTKVVQRWAELPIACPENSLDQNLVHLMLQALGLDFQQVDIAPHLGRIAGLVPDRLVYKDRSQPPVLVIENKRRVPALANISEAGFLTACKDHDLYREAVGYDIGRRNNGIKQYLDKDRVPAEFLASYGLVFNGDFFQLWRRVDGLVLPLTPIQKVTRSSLPGLMQQLQYCLENPTTALVAAVWNQKGGVAKTTNIINIGATLALQGKRVLLIDLDPQNDLTRGVGADASWFPDYLPQCTEKLQAEHWDDAKAIWRKAIQTRKFPTSDRREYELSVLSSDDKALKAFRDNSDVDPSGLFKRLVKQLQPEFDYIFIDISPTPDKLTQGALLACDTVLIPIDLGGKSLHHAVQLYNHTIPKFREVRAAKKERLYWGPWNLGIVFSNCPGDVGQALERCIEQELTQKSFAGKLCETRLRTFAQAKVAEFRHVPVISWQNSPITRLYTNLVNELFLNHNFIDH